LQLGRFQIHREPLDLRALVEERVAMAPPLALGQRILLGGDIPVHVMADRIRVSQVVAHLISNAVKFSPEGGDIEVDVSQRARVGTVSVRDHGIGIPLCSQAHIFERFYRAHADTPQDRGGTGLGLHLSREIVVLHGGFMWFESTEGVGSTFSLSLPPR
jgi:signal transduction histidine kinase